MWLYHDKENKLHQSESAEETLLPSSIQRMLISLSWLNAGPTAVQWKNMKTRPASQEAWKMGEPILALEINLSSTHHISQSIDQAVGFWHFFYLLQIAFFMR